jgi:hypothetical protein
MIYKEEDCTKMAVDQDGLDSENQPNYYIYRWVKKLLQIILNETTKFVADNKVLQTHLHVSAKKRQMFYQF